MPRIPAVLALVLLTVALTGCGALPAAAPTPQALFAPTIVVPARPAPTAAVDDALLLGLDNFRRATAGAWAAADRGGPYTLLGPEADFAVAPGVGTIRNPAPGDVRAASLLGVQARDVDVRVRLETDRPAAGGDQVVFLILRRTDDQDYYLGRIRFDPDQTAWLQAARTVGGKTVLLGDETPVSGYVHAAGIRLWIRAEAMGAGPTTVRLKGWASAEAEPQTWSYTTQDNEPALQVPGAVTIQTSLSDQITNAPVTFGFSDLRVSTDAAPAQVANGVTNPTPAQAVAAPAIATQSVAATPTLRATPAIPAPNPTPSAVDAWNALTPRLDAVWATDSVASLALLDDFQTRFPDFAPARDKLYAALVTRANQLLADDQPYAANALLTRAEQLLPERDEAVAAALALTPTPTAAPTSTPAPIVPVVRAPTPRPAAPVVRPAAPTAAPAAPPAAPTKAPFVPPARP